ncbi:glycine betaine ABC transporter substrate-binding protein [Nostoc sp. FACHB-888]|uniref:glycine betaine ABC transporter substrate-binding protein n=1 Tax=Nostoc sp. FACHB-888 TaxID=2692842 RepID=UPI0016842DC2|nr:glycine betaine ABC transporter substrate-binding protein [Nostoc sp. FACHB-888]MBD2248931.1 hypothetical protein [Nostoc sp. FACHB-888]
MEINNNYEPKHDWNVAENAQPRTYVFQDFERKFPPRTVAVLKRLYLGLDAVTEMDYQVNVARMTPKEAAIAWMSQNSKQVESWMAQE